MVSNFSHHLKNVLYFFISDYLENREYFVVSQGTYEYNKTLESTPYSINIEAKHGQSFSTIDLLKIALMNNYTMASTDT